jgi:hypothetical protein
LLSTLAAGLFLFCSNNLAHASIDHLLSWSDAATSWSGNSYNNSGSQWSSGSSGASTENDSSDNYSKDVRPSTYEYHDTQNSSYCFRPYACSSCMSASSSSTVAKTDVIGTGNSEFPILSDWLFSVPTTYNIGKYYYGTYSWHTHTDYSDNPPSDDTYFTLTDIYDTLYGCRGADSQSDSDYEFTPPDPATAPFSALSWYAWGYNDYFNSTLSCTVLYIERGEYATSGLHADWGWWLTPGPQIFQPASTSGTVAAPGFTVPLPHNFDHVSAGLPPQQIFPLENIFTFTALRWY